MAAKKLTFIYKYSDEYNPEYVNGAIGGKNPAGELVVNFYLERMPLPKKVQHAVNPDGSLGEPFIDPEDHSSNIIRFISSGVVMNLNSAKQLHAWLGQKIKELERE